MMEAIAFPAGLLEWAGHRAGGVKRLFDESSGRPSGALVETPLIRRLRSWAQQVASFAPNTPRILLLIGGPGNGKTEAVEHTIVELDAVFGLAGSLRDHVRKQFSPELGKTVPRTANVNLGELNSDIMIRLKIIQDASVGDAETAHGTPSSLLVSDLETALAEGEGFIFIACVNRGVLDDALIHAIDSSRTAAHQLLEAVIRGAGTSAAAPSCWPLAGFPNVAAWPMDIESLVEHRSESGTESAFLEILSLAINEHKWPAHGSCTAGARCPFCNSRALLSSESHRLQLASILRWYELATGKRWSFRELFTVVSFLLAGATTNDLRSPLTACAYAAKLIELDQKGVGRDRIRLAAPFLLVASLYQHALFGRWTKPRNFNIRAALRELKLEGHHTLSGLHHFLDLGRESSVPATLRPLLTSLCESLDPALADPEIEIPISGRATVKLRELDTRFSHSVREGLTFLSKHRCLSSIETDLLGRLADADDDLGKPEIRRRKSTAAVALQLIVRDYSCRLVRRSLGVRAGIVRDHGTLVAFKDVVDGKDELIHNAVKQVEGLLNQRDKFVVTLNTTFGEPLPPTTRQAVLTTAKQRVRPRATVSAGRPQADVRFLDVGTGTSTQSIPLTFELFRSVMELRNGLLASALPKTVVALLDTTRAKLAGRIVRDEDQLDGAEIRIGQRNEVVVRELQKFVVRQENQP